MQKILGLDIGTHSIKAVILWNDYKNYRIQQCYEQKVEYKESISEGVAQADAIDKLIKINQLEFDVVYAALDARHVSMRKVDFENIRKRDIPGFLENELESSSPFAIEDSILDYQIIDYSKSKSSVLAILSKKEVIKNILEIIEKEHLRVKVLDVDNLTYLNMISYLMKDNLVHQEQHTSQEKVENTLLIQSCIVIINIGHSKTTLTFMADKKILYTRIISIAGDYFNQILMKKFDLSYSDAELLKCFVGSIELDQTESGESKKNIVAAVLKESLTELSIEILRTIQSFQAKEDISIQSIYLTGGSSKIKGIYHSLENTLKIPVSNVLLKKENFIFSEDSENDFSTSENMAIYSQTIAIAMRGLPVIGVSSKINLRKGEFAQVSNYDKLIKQIFLYSGAVAAVVLCLLFSYFLRSFLYNKEINSLKNQFRKDIISMFSGEPYSLRAISSKKDWNFKNYGDEAVALVKQSMKDKKDLLEKYANEETPYVLQILNKVSQAVPKNLYFEVSEFNLRDGQLYIEAETNSPENINKIIESLAKIKDLNQVTKKSQSIKVGSDKKLTHFSIAASLSKEER
ncbi:pilus assembly protein PilM [Silvanigrella aquatica]|uniref:SHS2 domain-containing protein n=1 Tax=Silvanigrella aquatica TaxID=1915309 RepID=A0A1L4CYH2_9BACT|nr:pilus assembly protein PilM [Silvanigrella aquatica]APJ02999.1 hypothetical protein AXG55_03340 [Silvanigrella aquatica]